VQSNEPKLQKYEERTSAKRMKLKSDHLYEERTYVWSNQWQSSL